MCFECEWKLFSKAKQNLANGLLWNSTLLAGIYSASGAQAKRFFYARLLRFLVRYLIKARKTSNLSGTYGTSKTHSALSPAWMRNYRSSQQRELRTWSSMRRSFDLANVRKFYISNFFYYLTQSGLAHAINDPIKRIINCTISRRQQW